MIRLVSLFAISMLLLLMLCWPAEAQRPSAKPITLADIEKLISAKVSEDVIKAQVDASKAVFQLSTDDILRLKEKGMSDELLTFLIQTSGSNPAPAAEQPAEPGAAPPRAMKGGQNAPAAPLHLSPEAPLCKYLERLKMVTDKYELLQRKLVSKLTVSLDPEALAEVITTVRDEHQELLRLSPPAEIRDFHDRILSFTDAEGDLYQTVQEALLGSLSNPSAMSDAGMRLLERGKVLYDEHNSLRRRCGLPALPPLESLAL